MKSKFTMLIALLLMATTTIFAQGQQRQTVAERVKSTMDKLKDPLKLDQSQTDKTSAVFTDYYTAQDKMREDARASGNRPDRSVFEKMTNDRDEKLKAIFSADQYTKYKSEVEATLRPQRPQGAGNNQGGGNN
jgi:periplasmic protein CpxP/Spy